MTVIELDNTKFNDLKIGDIFKAQEKILMKMETISWAWDEQSGSRFLANSIDLRTGMLVYTDPENIVQREIGELIIGARRED